MLHFLALNLISHVEPQGSRAKMMYVLYKIIITKLKDYIFYISVVNGYLLIVEMLRVVHRADQNE